eukprot:scaffold61986_cov35-Tisochrysis_lutea.AAC.1
MSQGVTDRSMVDRWRSSQRYCNEPERVSAYEQSETTCAGPTSTAHHKLVTDPDDSCGIG